MQFIPESTINEVIESLNASDAALEKAEDHMIESQPDLVGFLTQEELDILSEEEQDFLMILSLSMIEAARRICGSLPIITAEALGDAEEQNYAMLESAKGTNFRDRISAFFDDYPQEDLLAFVEDALTDDEDDVVTQEGRETLFVTLKSVIDAMHACI